MMLVSAFLPTLMLSTVNSLGRGSGFSETGFGVDTSYFVSGKSALSLHYELNFGLQVKSLLVNGVSFGYTGYLVGGRRELLSRESLQVQAWPGLNAWCFVGIAQRHFDFSAYDVDKNATLYTKAKPISSGDIIAPELQLGFDYASSPKLRVGARVIVYQSIVADEDFSMMAAGGALSLGYEL